MTARFDIYKEVHKGVRKALFDLAALAGSTEFNHEQQLLRLKEQFNLTYNLLETHAHSEDSYVEPLLNQCDEQASRQIAETHARLEADISRLQNMLAQLDSQQEDIIEQGRQLYLELTRFIGEYLRHIADEEQKLMPLLWAHFDDAKLIQVSVTIRANIPPPVMKNFLSFMIPAMNHEERASMLIGMKQAAPPEVFNGVCQLSQKVLPENDWTRLDQVVSGVAQRGY